MAQSIPIDVYQFLEERVGKEEAKKVAVAIEVGFDVIEKKADAVALQKKLELKDELTKELVTKAEFFGEIKALRTELEGKMENVKIELDGRIDKLNMKLNFLIVLMVIALTLMNPVMADIIKHFLKL